MKPEPLDYGYGDTDYTPVYVLRDAVYEDNFDRVKKLVEGGVDINSCDDEGSTALMWAADEGHLDIVRYLCEHGADVNAQDKAGWTPVLLAANTSRPAVVEHLVRQGANLFATTRSGLSIRAIADRNNDSGLKLFLEKHGVPPVET